MAAVAVVWRAAALFIYGVGNLTSFLSAHSVIAAKNLDRSAIRAQRSKQRVIGNR